MRIKKTPRGFSLIEFKDNNNESCSLQKSSSALENKIWLGIDEVIISYRNYSQVGWSEINRKQMKEKLGADEIIMDGRMHLTRKQVKKLLPHLQAFVETGNIEVENE